MTKRRPSRDAAYWADPVSKLSVSAVPKEATSINVEGRQVVGPLQGFGQLWQKTYRVRLSGVEASPTEIIRSWKGNFPNYWPDNATFYAPLSGITPGEVALIKTDGPARTNLSTGVMVIYAGEESFTFMTPEGHIFAGWITFSSYLEDGSPVAQVQVLIRANDPLWEIVFRLFGSRAEDEMWHGVLRNVAAEYEIRGEVRQETTLVDPQLQWSQAKNVRYNAAIRSMLYAPVALFRRFSKRSEG
jgi:hypothetical protein